MHTSPPTYIQKKTSAILLIDELVIEKTAPHQYFYFFASVSLISTCWQITVNDVRFPTTSGYQLLILSIILVKIKRHQIHVRCKD
jgi:hypothetical protein